MTVSCVCARACVRACVCVCWLCLGWGGAVPGGRPTGGRLALTGAAGELRVTWTAAEGLEGQQVRRRRALRAPTAAWAAAAVAAGDARGANGKL